MHCVSFPSGDCHKPRPRSVARMLLGAAVLALMMNAGAQPPKIDLIQPFLGDRVLIHFDTEANLNYELNYFFRACCNSAFVAAWSPSSSGRSSSLVFLSIRSMNRIPFK